MSFPLKKMQDSFHPNHMSSWCMHVLTNLVNIEGDVGPSEGDVLKGPCNVAIHYRIYQWISYGETQFGIING